MSVYKLKNNKTKKHTYNGIITDSKKSTSNDYQPLVIRDKRLVEREAVSTTSGVHGIVLVPFSSSSVTDTVHINFKLVTNHTAQTSTVTATWGDGSTTTYTPDSSGNITIDHTYDYNDTDLDSFDTDIKQAYFKIEPTSDDMHFTDIDFKTFPDDSNYPQAKNHMIYELILKCNFSVDPKIFPSNERNQNLYNPSSMTSTQFGLRYLEIDTFKQDDGIRKNMPPPDKHNVLERVLIHDGRGLHFNSSFDQCKNLKEFTVLSDSTGASNKEATYSSYLFRTYAPQLFYINNTGNSKYKMSGEVFYNVGSNAGSDRGKIVLKGKWYNSSSYPFGSSSPTQGYKAESLIADTQDGTISTGIYGGLSAKWINNPNKEPNKNHVHTGTSSNSWTGLNKMFYYNNKIEDMIVYLPNADRTSVADHNMESMFSGCKGLREVEIKSPYYAVKPEDMSDMFNNATSLERVTLSGLGWDLAAQAAETSRKLDMERMFANCVALTYEGLPSQIKDLNLSSGVGNSSTQLDQMFNGAVNLRKPIDLTVTGSMACSFANLISNFYNETNILKIDGDNFDFSGITNSTTMGNVYIGYMPSLVSFTGVDFSSVGTGGGLLSFVNDVSLVEVDGLVYPSAANMFNMSFEKTNMSGSALDAVFTDVPDLTGQTARTITITNAKGAADCDTSIATAKNYTVTN